VITNAYPSLEGGSAYSLGNSSLLADIKIYFSYCNQVQICHTFGGENRADIG